MHKESAQVAVPDRVAVSVRVLQGVQALRAVPQPVSHSQQK